jgi:hypothetical protein
MNPKRKCAWLDEANQCTANMCPAGECHAGIYDRCPEYLEDLSNEELEKMIG